MDDQGTDSTTPPDPPAGSIHQSRQTRHGSPDHFNGWETIGERDHYDELDFLSPSCNLTMEKLKDRKEEDVVIFDYSLSLPDRNLPIEEGDPSSGLSNEEDDRFFQVSKDRLIESEEFNQTINYAKEPPPQSRRPRLVIM